MRELAETYLEHFEFGLDMATGPRVYLAETPYPS